MQLPVLQECLLEQPHLPLVLVQQAPVVDPPDLVADLVLVEVVEVVPGVVLCAGALKPLLAFFGGGG